MLADTIPMPRLPVLLPQELPVGPHTVNTNNTKVDTVTNNTAIKATETGTHRSRVNNRMDNTISILGKRDNTKTCPARNSHYRLSSTMTHTAGTRITTRTMAVLTTHHWNVTTLYR